MKHEASNEEPNKVVKRKVATFTSDPAFAFDYKDPTTLKMFISDRGKIIPRRVSGLSAKQQRSLTLAIKLARKVALLPYTGS